jgi:hypothetical protein
MGELNDFLDWAWAHHHNPLSLVCPPVVHPAVLLLRVQEERLGHHVDACRRDLQTVVGSFEIQTAQPRLPGVGFRQAVANLSQRAEFLPLEDPVTYRREDSETRTDRPEKSRNVGVHNGPIIRPSH